MIQASTCLAVADNSGARKICCIKVLEVPTGDMRTWVTLLWRASRRPPQAPK